MFTSWGVSRNYGGGGIQDIGVPYFLIFGDNSPIAPRRFSWIYYLFQPRPYSFNYGVKDEYSGVNYNRSNFVYYINLFTKKMFAVK